MGRDEMVKKIQNHVNVLISRQSEQTEWIRERLLKFSAPEGSDFPREHKLTDPVVNSIVEEVQKMCREREETFDAFFKAMKMPR